MGPQKFKEFMTFRRSGKTVIPLTVFKVNGNFILGIYQGSFSEFDILIKYRQKIGNSWSRIRTPKHIHWAIDILIKLHENRAKTQKFLDFLLAVWNTTQSVRGRRQQQNTLTIKSLLQDSQNMILQYESLSNKGEYSMKFLILLAKLLMIQEKTNLETAYMFKNLLEALRKGDDIFSVVSIASHTGRKI